MPEDLDEVAGERQDARWDAHRDNVRFAHMGPEALATFDRIAARGAPQVAEYIERAWRAFA